jgi:hypothetical protein
MLLKMIFHQHRFDQEWYGFALLPKSNLPVYAGFDGMYSICRCGTMQFKPNDPKLEAVRIDDSFLDDQNV